MYSPDFRQKALEKIVGICRTIDDIEGVLLVGSGGEYFPDKWADVDLSIVIDPPEKTKEVWDTLNERFRSSFNLISLGTGIYGENNYISILLLQNYLEIDAGIISLDNLEAKKDKWKILYEKEGNILTKMNRSTSERDWIDAVQFVNERVSTIGHYVRTFAVAINRNQLFRANKELEDVRNIVVDVWGVKERKVAKHYRDVDEADSDFRQELASTYPKAIEQKDLIQAFQSCFTLFFKISEECSPENSEIASIRTQLQSLLETFISEK